MFDILDLGTLLYRVPALLIALSFHEFAHAVVSDSLGDPTPSATGRLTINPMAHLDMLGTVMLVLCGFGWAKPVMIDPRYYKHYRTDMLKVSFAGPGMNLFLGFLSMLLAAILNRLGMLTVQSYQFIDWIMMYNVWFAFFNLLPVPPLDGSKILLSVLSDENYAKLMRYERYGMILLVALVATGILGRPLSAVISAVYGKVLVPVALGTEEIVQHLFYR